MKEQKKEELIKELTVYWGQVPVTVNFSYGSQNFFHFILVRVSNGVEEGWGEILSIPDKQFLSSAGRLIGRDALELDVLLDAVFGIEDLRREAFSIALHDLVSKVGNLPFYALLGSLDRRRIPLMPCIFYKSISEVKPITQFYLSKGFKHLKVKLVGKTNNDIKVISEIRCLADKSISLTGDVNEGYSFGDLQSGLLKDFKEAGLNIIEDPCRASPQEYAQLRSPEHPLIMIDCLGRKDHLFSNIIDCASADIVNLHPCQQGSVSRVMKRSQACEANNIKVMIGGTGYLGIGSAAYHHLAGVAGCELPCGEIGGWFDHGMPKLIRNSSVLKTSDHAFLTDDPGHGATPNLEHLEMYLTGSKKFSSPRSSIEILSLGAIPDNSSAASIK